MTPEPGRFILIEYDDGTTEPLPDLTDDDLDVLRQIADIDWTDTGYVARLAKSIEAAAQYNAALVNREKPEKPRAKKDRPTLFNEDTR